MMNKVVLITGGARRIGAETANYLHSKGMNILITYSKSSYLLTQIKSTDPPSSRACTTFFCIFVNLDDFSKK